MTTGSRRRPAAARRPVAAPRSNLLTVAMLALPRYFLFPLFWLVIASTKTHQRPVLDLRAVVRARLRRCSSNIRETFTHDDGEYGRWLLNTLLYAVVSAVGAAAAGHLRRLRLRQVPFPRAGARCSASCSAPSWCPTTALAIPTYLLFSKVGLVNTPWAVILPSLVSPFGLYLMWVYAQDAVPDSLLEAARIDGAGELRIFFRVALRSLAPGFVTVLLFTLVATWNNYFLPLIMLNNPSCTRSPSA